MEKPVRSKGGNKIFKYLPKATSFSIKNPAFSPGRDKRSDNSKLKAHNHRGFSGPIILIPAEAQRKGSNKSWRFEEPTSPKISCMGQIKHKKKSCCRSIRRASSPTKKQKRPSFTIAKMFRRKVRPGRQLDMDMDGGRPPVPARPPPSLGQIKKFSSSRDTLLDFDWKAQRAYMDEDSDEEDFIIPHSAPMLMGGGGSGGGGAAMEPKKEVNLWKRRTMAPPRPLQLN